MLPANYLFSIDAGDGAEEAEGKGKEKDKFGGLSAPHPAKSAGCSGRDDKQFS
jgi:hypothetical protein